MKTLAVVVTMAAVKKVEHTPEEAHDRRFERAPHFAARLSDAAAGSDVAVMENHVFSRQKGI